jgi:hypothetical protein
VFVVAALAIGLGVGLSLSKSLSTTSSVEDTPAPVPTSAPGPNAPTSAPGPVIEPGNVAQCRQLLYPLSSKALDDPSLPQSQAFNWVTNETAVRSSADIETRYVTVTIYYSWGGEAWANQYNFLSQNNVCMWNDTGDNGILCTDGDITKLSLCKSITMHQIMSLFCSMSS